MNLENDKRSPGRNPQSHYFPAHIVENHVNMIGCGLRVSPPRGILRHLFQFQFNWSLFIFEYDNAELCVNFRRPPYEKHPV